MPRPSLIAVPSAILFLSLSAISGCVGPDVEESNDPASGPLAYWGHLEDGQTRLKTLADSLQVTLDGLTSWFNPMRTMSSSFTLSMTPQPVMGEIRVQHESGHMSVDMAIAVREFVESEEHACEEVMYILERQVFPGKGRTDLWGNDLRLKTLAGRGGRVPPDHLVEAWEAAQWLIDRTTFTVFMTTEELTMVSCLRTGDGPLTVTQFSD